MLILLQTQCNKANDAGVNTGIASALRTSNLMVVIPRVFTSSHSEQSS